MTIGFASDHAGFQHKCTLLNYFKEQGYSCIDVGNNSSESADYPEFAHKLAELIENGSITMGFALCGTGNGMAITLNRHPMVRAGLAWNVAVSQLIRQHNDANVCVIPAKFVSEDDTLNIARAFVGAIFESGRHRRRVAMINESVK